MFDCNGAGIREGDSLHHPHHAGVFMVTHVFEKGQKDTHWPVPAPIGYVHAVNLIAAMPLSSFSYDQVTIDKEGVFRVKTWKEMAKETLELRTVDYRLDTLAGMFEYLIPSLSLRLEYENEGRRLENHPICKIFCAYMISCVGLDRSLRLLNQLEKAWEQIEELAK